MLLVQPRWTLPQDYLLLEYWLPKPRELKTSHPVFWPQHQSCAYDSASFDLDCILHDVPHNQFHKHLPESFQVSCKPQVVHSDYSTFSRAFPSTRNWSHYSPDIVACYITSRQPLWKPDLQLSMQHRLDSRSTDLTIPSLLLQLVLVSQLFIGYIQMFSCRTLRTFGLPHLLLGLIFLLLKLLSWIPRFCFIFAGTMLSILSRSHGFTQCNHFSQVCAVPVPGLLFALNSFDSTYSHRTISLTLN